MFSKGSFDLTTGTDLRSQAAIRSILCGEHPRHAFVGEESERDASPNASSYWLVDPICGTSNFAAGLAMYSVNIALVEDEQVVVGVVGDGATGQVYVAERGRGAYLAQTAHDQLVSLHSSDRSRIIVLDSGPPGGPAADLALRVFINAQKVAQWELRAFGSTVDLAYLATGSVVGVWHFSRIPPLHYAAGALLAAEAGAIVSDETGGRWGLESAGLVAAANAALHERILALATG